MGDEKNDKTSQENVHSESQFGPNVEDLLKELRDIDNDDDGDDKPEE